MFAFVLWHTCSSIYIHLFKDINFVHELLCHLYMYIVYNLWSCNSDSGFHEWKICFPEYHEYHISGCWLSYQWANYPNIWHSSGENCPSMSWNIYSCHGERFGSCWCFAAALPGFVLYLSQLLVLVWRICYSSYRFSVFIGIMQPLDVILSQNHRQIVALLEFVRYDYLPQIQQCSIKIMGILRYVQITSIFALCCLSTC